MFTTEDNSDTCSEIYGDKHYRSFLMIIVLDSNLIILR